MSSDVVNTQYDMSCWKRCENDHKLIMELCNRKIQSNEHSKFLYQEPEKRWKMESGMVTKKMRRTKLKRSMVCSQMQQLRAYGHSTAQ